MKSIKALLALLSLILLIGVAVLFITNQDESTQAPPAPGQTTQQAESQNESSEISAPMAASELNNDDSLASAASDETPAQLLLPSQVVDQVFPKVNLDALAFRLPAEEFAVYERTRLEFPEVDWTEVDPAHQAFLAKRAEFPLNLNDPQREAYAAWLAEVEPMSRALVKLRAEAHGLSAGGMEGDTGYYIEGFRDGEPVYTVTTNVTAANTTGVSYLRWNPGFDPALGDTINGGEIYVNVNDHGEIFEHTEFQLPNAGGSRIMVKEVPWYENANRNHMTHVAGTMTAWGYNSSVQGMAPRSWIRSLIQQSLGHITTYGMATPGQDMGIANPRTGNFQLRSVVGNTSLGSSTPYNRYNSVSASFDTVLRDHPYYMHFYSSGNSGSGGYETLTGAHKIAKNMITIGNASAATRDADGVYTGGGNIAGSSSRGPTYDGRISPDFVGKGTSVLSTVGEANTAIFSGTSMASPNVAGSVALLMDYVRQRLPQEYLRSSTYRALLATTADDRGNPGPDYIYGWGILNIHAAAKIVRQQAKNPSQRLIVEDSLAPGQTWTENYASEGVEPIRVTITWLDPASTNTDANSRAPRIVNDLDLRLIGSDDTEHKPYVMPFTTGQGETPAFDSSLYKAHAVLGDNFTDTVEQVYLAAPAAGTYTVQVTHKGNLLNNQAQPFSVAVSGLNSDFDPSMEVVRNGSPINAGGADGVSGTTAGSGTQLTYTISNGGDVPLELTTPVTISGQQNCSVTVNTQPTAIVDGGESTSLVTTVTPAADGTWSFNISIANNDPEKNPYHWHVTGIAGSAEAPLMVVSGSNGVVSNGGTDSGADTQLTYTIANLGSANLTLTTPVTATAVSNCLITVSAQPSATVAPSASTNLVLNVTPSSAGDWSATVSITNNDADKTPYTWTISGNAVFNQTVTYNGNGNDSGTAPVDPDSPYFVGATVTVLGPGTLAKSGHSFAEWITAGNSYSPGDTFTITSSTTLFAQWAPNSYTVTFDSNGGDPPTSSTKEVTFNSPYGTLPTATRAGHSFSGWFTAPTGGTQVTAATPVAIAENHTLYARWIAGSNGTWLPTAGGTFNWEDPANWLDGAIANSTDATAFFAANITADQTINLDVPRTIGNLVISNTANSYTINGSALTLSRSSDHPVIDVQTNRWISLISPIFSSTGLRKDGDGQVMFINNNSSWTGNTIVSNGLLDFRVLPLANISGGSGRNITVEPGAAVKYIFLENAFLNRIVETEEEITVMTGTTNGNLDFSSSTGANLPNAFLGNWAGNGVKAEYSGTITPAADYYRLGGRHSNGLFGIRSVLTGSQGLIVGGTGAGGVRINLVAANTFTGDTIINLGARLVIGNNLALQNSPLDLATSGGDFALAAGTNTGRIAGETAASSPTFGGLIGNRNLLEAFTNVGGIAETNLDATSVTGFTLNLGSGKNLEYTGAIANFATGTTLTKTGPGTQILAGNNTYTGATTVTAGKLFINGDQSTASGNVSVAAGATLGGTGIIGGNTTIAANGRLEFDLSTHADSHDTLELAATRTLNFSGASVLTITTNGDVGIGTYTLVTAPGGITGSAPGTLNLPEDWEANVSIVGNDLVLHLTNNGQTSYPVSYQGNGNTQGAAPLTQSKIEDIDLILAGPGDLLRAGYTFTAWTTAADGSGVTYAAGETYTTNAALTLYAQWVPNNFTVTFDANGGEAPDPATKQVTFDATYGTLPPTTRTGHAFSGWFTAASGGTEVTAATVVAIAGNHTLHAQWIADTYTVTYNGNGNTSGTAPADQSKSHDVDLTLATNTGILTKTDFSFAGWNTEPDGTGTDYPEGSIYTDNAPLTLHAKWTPGADGTWLPTTAGPFNWSDPANWQDGIVASGSGHTAFFTPNITETQIANLDASRTIGNITFTDSGTSSHNLTISGANVLILDAVSDVPTINVTQNNRTLTINSQIAGNAGIQKNGGGTLNLGAINTFAGGLTINGGALVVGTADTSSGHDALGAAGGTVFFTTNTTLNLSSVSNFTSDKALSLSSGVTLSTSAAGSTAVTTFSGVLSGGSNTTIRGHANSSFDQRSLVFTNTANTYDGKIDMRQNFETFRFASIGDSVGAGTISFGQNSPRRGSFRLDTTAIAPMVLNNRQIEITGNGSSGVAQIANVNTTASNTLTINTDLLVTGTGGDKILEFSGVNTGNNTFAGVIANGGLTTLDVDKTSGGTWILSGDNTYTGITTVNAGKLFINGDQSSATGDVSVSANATLGGTGTLGGNTTIAANGRLEFDLSTPAASHDKLELAATRTLTFSGASVLNITTSGGASPGTYTLVTAPGGITGNAPATVNLPEDWEATTEIIGNDLVLNVTSTGSGPGPVASFAITGVPPQATAGVAITGITITALDENDAVATSFTGTVTFGGSGGFTGTSANFVGGILTGVGITPTVAGSALTFTVDDGAGHTGTVTIATILSIFDDWASASGLTGDDAAPGADPDGDGLTNLQEFAFGTNPTGGASGSIAYQPGGSVTNPGTPILLNIAGGEEYHAIFGRRKDHQAAGLSYRVEFSAGLDVWVMSDVVPTVLTAEDSDGDIEAVGVPYPLLVPGDGGDKKPRFFRVGVSME